MSVNIEIKNQIAEITINRPENLNALNLEVLSDLRGKISQLNKQTGGPSCYQDVRAVIISGAGDKAFVAGADIKVMQAANAQELAQFVSLGQGLMLDIERLALPVIALVQGYAIGGGLELALACDLIVAGEQAKLGQAEINLGLIPGFGGTQRLSAKIGLSAAKRLIYFGDSINAPEAYRLGLVDYLFPQAELRSKVLDLAHALAAKPPLTLAAAKRAINNHLELSSGLNKEVEEFLALFKTSDTKEGLKAFIEKRKPQFIAK